MIKLVFPTTSDSGIEVKFKTDMMYLPSGYYTLEKLISTLNAYVSEYDVRFTILNSGRIGVTYSIEREYWYSDVHIKKATSDAPVQVFQTFTQNTDEGNEFEMVFTETLEYMLGLRKIIVHPSVEKTKEDFNAGAFFFDNAIKPPHEWYHFMNKANKKGDNNFACSFMAEALPDISNGVDKMFIYCDQVEMSIVGDTYASLLAIVPLKGEDRGSGALCVYTPPDTRRRLIKSKIDQFKIGIYDTTHTLIPFSSGTINIECIIE
ncbi:Hypothetical predicted protein [Paramuricea clavata]|uniref:Uncharacterized protein n=1 Tax=Paramuricea clavata TaxID=317549 RepID=A0A7D9EQQ1_PARCT|nr:Hypothetical predicted protein [Paramuricea clavata]